MAMGSVKHLPKHFPKALAERFECPETLVQTFAQAAPREELKTSLRAQIPALETLLPQLLNASRR